MGLMDFVNFFKKDENQVQKEEVIKEKEPELESAHEIEEDFDTEVKQVKGQLGEDSVNLTIMQRLNKDKYHLIKRITLPTTSGGSTQVDHIVVSIYGVFVIETKNMKGWIFGTERQKMWTQSISKKNRYQFQNPLHQNYKHIKAIQKITGLADEKLHSLVIFEGECELKTETPDNVTKGDKFIGYIKSKTKPLIKSEEIQGIIDNIKTNRLNQPSQADIKHVEHVKNIVEEKNKK